MNRSGGKKSVTTTKMIHTPGQGGDGATPRGQKRRRVEIGGQGVDFNVDVAQWDRSTRRAKVCLFLIMSFLCSGDRIHVDQRTFGERARCRRWRLHQGHQRHQRGDCRWWMETAGESVVSPLFYGILVVIGGWQHAVQVHEQDQTRCERWFGDDLVVERSRGCSLATDGHADEDVQLARGREGAHCALQQGR